jgi:hypothetical protein
MTVILRTLCSAKRSFEVSIEDASDTLTSAEIRHMIENLELMAMYREEREKTSEETGAASQGIVGHAPTRGSEEVGTVPVHPLKTWTKQYNAVLDGEDRGTVAPKGVLTDAEIQEMRAYIAASPLIQSNAKRVFAAVFDAMRAELSERNETIDRCAERMCLHCMNVTHTTAEHERHADERSQAPR